MATKQTYFKFRWIRHSVFCSWIAAVKDDNKEQGVPSATLATFWTPGGSRKGCPME